MKALFQFTQGAATLALRHWSGMTAGAVLLVCSTVLAACQRSESVPPAAPTVVDSPARAGTELPAVPASGADNSVPDAGRVLAAESSPAVAARSSDPTANQRSSITPEQESKSMPLPGQANDHSNTAADKPATATAARSASGVPVTR